MEQTLSQIFYNDGLNGLVREVGRRIHEATAPLHQEISYLRNRLERAIDLANRHADQSERWRETAMTAQSRANKALVDHLATCIRPMVFTFDEAADVPPGTFIPAGWPTPVTGTFAKPSPEKEGCLTYETLRETQRRFMEETRPVVFHSGYRAGRSAFSGLVSVVQHVVNDARRKRDDAQRRCEALEKQLTRSAEDIQRVREKNHTLVEQLQGRDAVLHTRGQQIDALRKVVDSFAGAGVSSLCLDKPETFLNQTEVTK